MFSEHLKIKHKIWAFGAFIFSSDSSAKIAKEKLVYYHKSQYVDKREKIKNASNLTQRGTPEYLSSPPHRTVCKSNPDAFEAVFIYKYIIIIFPCQ